MASVAGLLFWQPVLSGKQFLQQFLRLKVAAQILGSAEAARVDTRELRERLLRGDSVEVAGYELSPALAAGLEAADLAPIAGRMPCRVDRGRGRGRGSRCRRRAARASRSGRAPATRWTRAVSPGRLSGRRRKSPNARR